MALCKNREESHTELHKEECHPLNNGKERNSARTEKKSLICELRGLAQFTDSISDRRRHSRRGANRRASNSKPRC